MGARRRPVEHDEPCVGMGGGDGIDVGLEREVDHELLLIRLPRRARRHRRVPTDVDFLRRESELRDRAVESRFDEITDLAAVVVEERDPVDLCAAPGGQHDDRRDDQQHHGGRQRQQSPASAADEPSLGRRSGDFGVGVGAFASDAGGDELAFTRRQSGYSVGRPRLDLGQSNSGQQVVGVAAGVVPVDGRSTQRLVSPQRRSMPIDPPGEALPFVEQRLVGHTRPSRGPSPDRRRTTAADAARTARAPPTATPGRRRARRAPTSAHGGRRRARLRPPGPSASRPAWRPAARSAVSDSNTWSARRDRIARSPPWAL